MAAEVPKIDQSAAHTVKSKNDQYCQTDIDAEAISNLFSSLDSAKLLVKQLNMSSFSFESFRGDNDKTEFYTGIDTFGKLEKLIDLTRHYIPINVGSTAPVEEQILLTLIKLKLNLDFVDLGYNFDISPDTASTYFRHFVEVFYRRLSSFVKWPSREILLKTMPSCYKDAFGDKVPVIIDCFEVFIEKPSVLATAAECWSHSKRHHTVKYLIGITPQQTVCFISEGWGGRAFNQHITMNSNLVNNIPPGGLVIANGEFLMDEYVRPVNTDVGLQVFTKENNQLQRKEIEETRATALVRNHIYRVVGTMKQKYGILANNSNTAISLLSHDEVTFLYKIVTVCCALINFGSPL